MRAADVDNCDGWQEPAGVASDDEAHPWAPDGGSRIETIDAILAACPELRRCETSEDAEVTAAVFAELLGPMSQTEVAHVFGVSAQRIGQIEARALATMRRALEGER